MRCKKCGGKLVMQFGRTVKRAPSSSVRKILYCMRCKLIQVPPGL